jgi:hypothetical protein
VGREGETDGKGQEGRGRAAAAASLFLPSSLPLSRAAGYVFLGSLAIRDREWLPTTCGAIVVLCGVVALALQLVAPEPPIPLLAFYPPATAAAAASAAAGPVGVPTAAAPAFGGVVMSPGAGFPPTWTGSAGGRAAPAATTTTTTTPGRGGGGGGGGGAGRAGLFTGGAGETSEGRDNPFRGSGPGRFDAEGVA